MARKNTNKGDTHSVHVFVYGSLKKTLGNHSLMTAIDAEFVGFDTISGPFTMVSRGGFPATCHDSSIEGAAEIYGQLYKIPPEGLHTLDALEGHPRWYRREKLVTNYHDQRAWIYLMPESELKNYEVVENNLWRPTEEELTWCEEKNNGNVA